MTARTLQGLALVSLGRVAEGTALLDEGAAAATAGELHDPIAIGSCCCNMIIACERSRDFDRAGQWCEQLAAFCERTGQRPLLALCRAHHGTVLMMRGDWPEAEQELVWAAGELSTLRPPLAGYARARLAQLRRRQGRNGEARALVAQAGAHVLARLVQAEIALDEDDLAAALAHAERYLRGCLGGEESIERAAALELLVPILIARGIRPGRARRTSSSRPSPRRSRRTRCAPRSDAPLGGAPRRTATSTPRGRGSRTRSTCTRGASPPSRPPR